MVSFPLCRDEGLAEVHGELEIPFLLLRRPIHSLSRFSEPNFKTPANQG